MPAPSRVIARRPALAVCVLLLSLSLFSQDTTTPTITHDVKVVNVLATVRDKKGNIVNNLTQNDFKLTQDGQPQTIHYFTRETDLPLTLGLLVDTSMSQRDVIFSRSIRKQIGNPLFHGGSDEAVKRGWNS